MDTALRERLGEEEAGQPWAGPLGRSSCPRAEAQWKDPGLSARTFPPEFPQVQPPALGGGSRGLGVGGYWECLPLSPAELELFSHFLKS